MISKISEMVVSSLAIVMAIIAYYTKDMSLAAFAFTVHTINQLWEHQ